MFTFIKRIYFLNSSLGFESAPKNETISIIIRNFCPLVDPDLSCINCVMSFTFQWFQSFAKKHFLPKSHIFGSKWEVLKTKPKANNACSSSLLSGTNPELRNVSNNSIGCLVVPFSVEQFRKFWITFFSRVNSDSLNIAVFV